jgi:hypothetical protein
VGPRGARRVFRKAQAMITACGDDDVASTTAELLRDVADELRREGIEIRFVNDHEHGLNPRLEAWYVLNPARVAIVGCDEFGSSLGTGDCLAIAVREQLRATVVAPQERQTWDHTGTLWPDPDLENFEGGSPGLA